LNVSINPGNSGGPVLSPKGRVIGLATAKAKTLEALALCIPSEDLGRVVKAAEARPAGEGQRVLAIHRTWGVLHDLQEAGAVYYALVNAYTEKLAEADRIGRDLRSANWELRKLLDEKLRPLEDFVKTSLHSRLTSVCTDPLVPVEIRLKISDLWCNYLKIRDQLY
jgi:hypothetical protein